MMKVHVREATRCKRGFRNAQSTPARSNCARPFQRAKLNCKRTSGRACIYPNHHCFFVSSKDHAPRSRFLYTQHGPMPLTSSHQPRAHIHTHVFPPPTYMMQMAHDGWCTLYDKAQSAAPLPVGAAITSLRIDRFTVHGWAHTCIASGPMLESHMGVEGWPTLHSFFMPTTMPNSHAPNTSN